MTKKEYFNQIMTKEINVSRVERVQEVYATIFPEFIQKIISNNEETVFFDDENRLLSFEEIIDAESDLHVDFKLKGIIPLVDCGDNDFIVYHFRDDIWSKFNIVDEIVFKRKNKFDDLLEDNQL